MIDLVAIKKRCEKTDRLVKEQLWLVHQATSALKDRVELVAEVKRLRRELEWAEAVAHEAGAPSWSFDLEAIKKRCDIATKGPWMVHQEIGGVDSPALDDPDANWQVAKVARAEDRKFIARARKDVPELVAEVGRLREELEQCQRSGIVAYMEMEVELHTDQLRDEVTSLRAVIGEVAIPSLLYCERMYDHDDMARLNLEAALQLRKRVEGSEEERVSR